MTTAMPQAASTHGRRYHGEDSSSGPATGAIVARFARRRRELPAAAVQASQKPGGSVRVGPPGTVIVGGNLGRCGRLCVGSTGGAGAGGGAAGGGAGASVGALLDGSVVVVLGVVLVVVGAVVVVLVDGVVVVVCVGEGPPPPRVPSSMRP